MSYAVRGYLIEMDGSKAINGELKGRYRFKWVADLRAWNLNRIDAKYRKRFPYPYWKFEVNG